MSEEKEKDDEEEECVAKNDRQAVTKKGSRMKD